METTGEWDFIKLAGLRELRKAFLHIFEEVEPESSFSIVRQAIVHKFTRLRLKKSALQCIGLPVIVEKGVINSVETDVDIGSLFPSADGDKRSEDSIFRIRIQGVKIMIRPIEGESNMGLYLEVFKSLKLALNELFQNHFQKMGDFLQLYFRTRILIEDVVITFVNYDLGYSLRCSILRMQHIAMDRQFKANMKKLLKRRKRKDGKQTNQSDAVVSTFEIVDFTLTEHVLGEAIMGKPKLLRESVIIQPISLTVNLCDVYMPSLSDADAAIIQSEDIDNYEFFGNEGIKVWGLTFFVFTRTTLLIELQKHSVSYILDALQYFADSNVLNSQERSESTLSLDWLRWRPPASHATDYWTFCIRKLFPHVAHRVGELQGIKLPKDWVQNYGLMSSSGHRERYIELYTRSLNLVLSEPMTRVDYNELSELEAQHALDTLILWRTEAKLRLVAQRPDILQRIARTTDRDNREKHKKVFDAVFSVFQNVVPITELLYEEKLKIYEKSLRLILNRIAKTIFQGANITFIASRKSGGVALSFRDNMNEEPVRLFVDELNLETDIGLDKMLIQLLMNGFRELPNSKGIQKYFKQKSGTMHLFARIPQKLPKFIDMKRVDNQYISFFASNISCVNVLATYDLIINKLLQQFIKNAEAVGLVKGRTKVAREAHYDINIIDSTLTFVFSDEKNNERDELQIVCGQGERVFVNNTDKAPNIKIELTVKPKIETATIGLFIDDIVVNWLKYDKKFHTKPSHILPFLPIVSGWHVEASLRRLKVEDGHEVDEYEYEFHGDELQICITQEIIKGILRILKSKLEDASSHYSFLKADNRNFSFRSYIHDTNLSSNSTSIKHSNWLPGLLLYTDGIDIRVFNLLEVESERYKKNSNVNELSLVYLQLLRDHLWQNFIRVYAENSSFDINSSNSIVKYINRIQNEIIKLNPWNETFVTTCRFNLSKFLSWHIMKQDMSISSGLQFDTLESVLPQGLFNLLEMLLLTDIEYQKKTSQSQNDNFKKIADNDDFCTFSAHEFLLLSLEKPNEQGSSNVLKLARAARSDFLNEELEEGINLQQYGFVSIPKKEDTNKYLKLKSLLLWFKSYKCKFVELQVMDLLFWIPNNNINAENLKLRIASAALHYDLLKPFVKLVMNQHVLLDDDSNSQFVHNSSDNFSNKLIDMLILICHLSTQLNRTQVALKKKNQKFHINNYQSIMNFHDLQWIFQSKIDRNFYFKFSTSFDFTLPYTYFMKIKHDTDMNMSLFLRGKLEAELQQRRTLADQHEELFGRVELENDTKNLRENEVDDCLEGYIAEFILNDFEIVHVVPSNASLILDDSNENGNGNDNDNNNNNNNNNDNNKQAFYKLPPLPRVGASIRSMIKNQYNEVMYKGASWLLMPINIDGQILIAPSQLNHHHSNEDREILRKTSGKRYILQLSCKKDVVLHLTARDFLFIIHAYQLQSNHQTSFNSQFNVKLEIIPEIDLHFNAPSICLKVLDEFSDSEDGGNPIIQVQLLNKSVLKYSQFASETKLKINGDLMISSPLKRQEGIVAPPNLSTLFEAPKFSMTMSNDMIADHQSNQMVSTLIVIRELARLHISQLTAENMMTRLLNFKKRISHKVSWTDNTDEDEDDDKDDKNKKTNKNIHGEEDDSDNETSVLDEPEEENMDRFVTPRTIIMNATGGDIWYKQPLNLSSIPIVIKPGYEEKLTSEIPSKMSINPKYSALDLHIGIDSSERETMKLKLLPEFSEMAKVDTIVNSFTNDVYLRARSNYDSINDTRYLKLYSNVMAINDTEDVIECFDDIISPNGGTVWLPIVRGLAGKIKIRPTNKHTWSRLIHIDFNERHGKVYHDKTTSLSYQYHHATCTHEASGGVDWEYCIQIIWNNNTKVKTLRFTSPHKFCNGLGVPIRLTLKRPAKYGIKYIHENKSKIIAQMKDTNQNVHNSSQFIKGNRSTSSQSFIPLEEFYQTRKYWGEQAIVGVGNSWQAHGVPFDYPADLSLEILESKYISKRMINLCNTNELKRGWELVNKNTLQKFKVFIVPINDNCEESFQQVWRIFTHYVFVDRTELKLRFTENFSYSIEANDFKGNITPFSSNLSNERKIHLGSPLCPLWSAALSIPTYGENKYKSDIYLKLTEPDDDNVNTNDDNVKSSDDNVNTNDSSKTRTMSHIVKVPTNTHLVTDKGTRQHEAFSDVYCADIICEVSYPWGYIGPAIIKCRPRIKIVNRLKKTIAIKPVISDIKSVGPPLFITASSSSPLLYWNNDERNENQYLPLHGHVPKVDLFAFLIMNVENNNDNNKTNFENNISINDEYEWSNPIPIHKNLNIDVCVHSIMLSNRTIVEINVQKSKFHTIITLNQKDPSSVFMKIQNQSSLCSMMVAEKIYPKEVSLDYRTRFWQVLHPKSATVYFSWSTVSDELHKPLKNKQIKSSLYGVLEVNQVQRPQLLTVKIFTHDEIIELDIDMDWARLGARKRIRFQGSRPDLLLQTRIERSTGSIVLVMSDFVPKYHARSILYTFESEERKFIRSLLRQHFGVTDMHRHHHIPKRVVSSPMAINPNKAQYGFIIIDLVKLKGMKFENECEYYYVISFGKQTRSGRFYINGKVSLSQQFRYDFHHRPQDIDYDIIYLDIYERDNSFDTKLMKTVTIKGVQELLILPKEEIVVECYMHSLQAKKVKHINVAKQQNVSFEDSGKAWVRIRTSYNSNTVNNLPVGMLKWLNEFICPKLQVTFNTAYEKTTEPLQIFGINISRLNVRWAITHLQESIKIKVRDMNMINTLINETVVSFEKFMDPFMETRNYSRDIIQPQQLPCFSLNVLMRNEELTDEELLITTPHSTNILTSSNYLIDTINFSLSDFHVKLDSKVIFEIYKFAKKLKILPLPTSKKLGEDSTDEIDDNIMLYIKNIDISPIRISMSLQTGVAQTIISPMIEVVKETPFYLKKRYCGTTTTSVKQNGSNNHEANDVIEDSVRIPLHLDEISSNDIQVAHSNDWPITLNILKYITMQIIQQIYLKRNNLNSLTGYSKFKKDCSKKFNSENIRSLLDNNNLD